MTWDEVLELKRDLDYAGIRIVDIHHMKDDTWQIECVCEMPRHTYNIINPQLFRETVRYGLIKWIPRNAFDRKG